MIPVLCLVLMAVLVVIDQITKYFVVLNLKPIGSVNVIGEFFRLSYLENTGAAFGMLENHRWIFISITILGCLALIIFMFVYKHHNFFSYAAITLIVAGGVGNLIDRIINGYVVDFLSFNFFRYTFNFADCCVTVGAVCVIIAFIISEKESLKESKNSKISEDENIEEEIASNSESKENEL